MTQDQRARLLALQHAMQSGVMFDHENGGDSGSPKHLRVGVNSAMVEHGALAKLLVAKGIITEDEYFDALTEGMAAEVVRYEELLSEKLGKKVHLL